MSDRLLGRRIEHNVKEELERMHSDSKDLHARLQGLVKGRKVRIASNYNGQPYGRSRKALTGQVFEVERAGLDPHWGIYLFLKGERLSIRANEVEWL